MITSIEDVRGLTLEAKDGEIGTVKDLLFDDAGWSIRYIAADTGGWLTGRQVLLTPDAVEEIGDRVRVNLTKDQVEGSPPLTTDQPVSRQWETDLYGYYGYAPYWGYAAGWAAPVAMAPAQSELDEASVTGTPEGDPHLRSAGEVTGYHVQATDDEIGHVEELLLDDASWTIASVVVDTRNILPGKKVVLGVGEIESISYSDRLVRVSVPRREIERRPEVDA